MAKYNNIDAYIGTFPEDVRKILSELRSVIRNTIPEVKERISYNMPTFVVEDEDIIYFAAWKSHVSLYPFTKEMEEAFTETKDYNTSGKGTIQFPFDKPLPYPLIKKLIEFKLERLTKTSS